MPHSISEIIYQSFFEHLSRRSNVKPETIQALKSLYESNQMTSKHKLARLTEQMEIRHAQDQIIDHS